MSSIFRPPFGLFFGPGKNLEIARVCPSIAFLNYLIKGTHFISLHRTAQA